MPDQAGPLSRMAGATGPGSRSRLSPAGLLVPWAEPWSQPPRALAQEASLQLGRAKAAAGSQKVDPALTARIAEEAAAMAAAAAAAKRENDTVYLQRVPPPDSIARYPLPHSAVSVTGHWAICIASHCKVLTSRFRRTCDRTKVNMLCHCHFPLLQDPYVSHGQLVVNTKFRVVLCGIATALI